MLEDSTVQGGIAEAKCSFCNGTGRDPFGIMSWLSRCCVCSGRGVVLIQTPYIRCAHCQGTGAIKTFTCTVCMGKGFVAVPQAPTALCPECGGSGDDHSAPSLPCLTCHGHGFVQAG